MRNVTLFKYSKVIQLKKLSMSLPKTEAQPKYEGAISYICPFFFQTTSALSRLKLKFQIEMWPHA